MGGGLENPRSGKQTADEAKIKHTREQQREIRKTKAEAKLEIRTMTNSIDTARTGT